MNLRPAISTALVALSLFPASGAFARDCTIAETVFTDGLYGMGAGLVVGALWMTANVKNTQADEVVPTLATGALVGGGVGAVLGIVEVGICLNNQKSASANPKAGLQIPTPVFLPAKSFAQKSTGMGMNFKYIF